MPTSEISQLVQSFASDLAALVRRETIGELQRLLEAQIGGGRPRRLATRGTTAKLRRRAPVLDRAKVAEAVLTFVRTNPGARGEQIAEAVGGTSDAIRPTIKALLAAGELRSEGKRRGMRYFADSRPISTSPHGARSEKPARNRRVRTQTSRAPTAVRQATGSGEVAREAEASEPVHEASPVPF